LLTPFAILVVDTLPRQEILGWHPPLTTGGNQVAEGIENQSFDPAKPDGLLVGQNLVSRSAGIAIVDLFVRSVL